MNIIYFKQAIKEKVNTYETKKALSNLMTEILGDETKFKFIKTDDIPDVNAGTEVMIAVNKSKCYLITVGASTKNIHCVTDNGNDDTYYFEYIMELDKKILGELDEDFKANEKLVGALRMVGSVATNARNNTLVGGNYGEVLNGDTMQYSGLVVTDFKHPKDKTDVETCVTGRKGKMHLYRLIPLLENEIDVLRYIEDDALSEVVALMMVKDKKGAFSSRKKSFNFSCLIPSIDKRSEEELKELGIKVDKGKALVYKVDDIDKLLSLEELNE